MKRLLICLMCLTLGAHAQPSDRDHRNLTACTTNLKNYATACEMWAADHKGVYPKSFKQLVPEYLRHLPKCPAGKGGYSYRPDQKKLYQVRCTSGGHKALGIQKGELSYNGLSGLEPKETLDYVRRQYQQAHLSPLQQCRQNLMLLGRACEMYRTDHKNPPKSLALLKNTYVKAIPPCPAAGKDTYSKSYKLLKHGNYRLHCAGHFHKKQGYKRNFPAYDSAKGSVEK